MVSQADGRTIRLLHVSDLHARASTAWDAERPARTLVDNLTTQVAQGRRPDLVLFTGDLAWAGRPEEFAQGWRFLEEVLDACELEPDALFLVPGNHDVDRGRIGRTDARWAKHTDRDEVEEILAEGGDDWRGLAARLDIYRAFLDEHKLAHLQTDPDRVIWTAERTIRNCSIGLAGFNTAWSCGATDEKGRLWTGAHWQHETLHADVRDADVRIALLHHPTSWLHEHEGRDFTIALRRDFHLTLHGHEHKTWVDADADGHATLAAGASFDGSRRENGYSLIELDRADAKVHVHLWAYDADGGGWVERSIANRTKRGIWTFDADWLGADDASSSNDPPPPPAATSDARPSESAAPSEGARLLRRFRRTQRNENAEIQLVGFPVRLKLDVALDKIYVSQRASLHDALRDHEAFGGAREVRQVLGDERDVPLDEAFALAHRLERRGLVVLGEPGSGKTTLLKHFLLTDPSRLQLPDDTVPVLVLLRRLAQPDAGLRAALCATIREDPYFTEARAETLADHLLGDARVLLLLDGFDEIGDAGERARTARWIETAAKQQRGRWTFVLTSRYAGYQAEARLRGSYAELHVRDLTSAEAGRFIQRWYRVVVGARGKGPDDRPATRTDADRLSVALHKRIFNEADARGQSLRLLACNPMMLQILCLLQWDQGQLPERRAALYEACVRTLLQLWRKDLGLGFDAEAAQAVLEPLAWHLHVAGAEELPREEIEPVIADPLRTQRRAIDLLPAGFLDAVRDQTGVLVSTGRGNFGFLHLSFQEYLAARHVRSQSLSQPALVRELASRFDVQAWREVILLALGLTSPNLFGPVMQALIDAGALSRNPSLASDCLRDAAEPSAVPLLEALAEGVEDARERFQVLRLLKSDVFGDWMDATIEDGRTGREVLEALRADASDGEVRGLLRELLGIEALAIVSGIGEPEAESERTHEQDGSVLAYVPGGSYRLGGWGSPIHTVRLSPYWIGKYPVTNAQYGTFLEATKYEEPEYWGDKQFNGSDQPVVGVSWYDAQAYCAWAGLVLPSEAQWEAAARGTDQRNYPWGGAEPTEKLANFDENVGRTTPVGSYPAGAGPFGALDQAGNVWEWCVDLWGASAYAQRDGETDPVRREENLSESARRVLRGGSWALRSGFLRAAYRFRGPGYSRLRRIGFRVSLRSPSTA